MEQFFREHKPVVEMLYSIIKHKYYKNRRPGQKLKHNLKNIIEGILYVCKTGIQWSFCLYKNMHTFKECRAVKLRFMAR